MAAKAVVGQTYGTSTRLSTHKLRTPLRVATTLALVYVMWLGLAPVQLGGSASYVVTEGTSMLPRFKADGLVITRVQDEYRVGQVVAYHNREMHAIVMHRIMARDGNRYVFKGDNNNFVDEYQPTQLDIVGKEIVYWPGVGRYLKVFRDPINFAIAIALIALFSLRVPRRSRRRRRHHAW